jgi:predicted secreted protein
VTVSDGMRTSTSAIYHFATEAENTSIDVTPDTWAQGNVSMGSSNATTGYHFNLTNDGGFTVNVQINATNATNATTGFKWNLTSSPSTNNFNLPYNKNGAGVWKNINLTYDTFVNNLMVNSWQTFDLKIYMATTTSASANYTMVIEVTFKAVVT